jgi:catechol 2,3-dioxygenase-like lactoylglutathione lyase family enzyme
MIGGAFLHIKIDVADLARSLRFYLDTLGWRQIVRYDRDDGVTIVQVSPTGQPPGIELWHEPPNSGFHLDRLHFAISTVDLLTTIKRLAAQGVEIERSPFRIGHELIAFVRDPDGYLIEFNEVTVGAPVQAGTTELPVGRSTGSAAS